MYDHGSHERVVREYRAGSSWLAIFLFIIAVSASIYGLIVIVGAAKEILIAVIAASASLLSAIFAYFSQRAANLEIASMQRERELELAAAHREKELELVAIQSRRELEQAERKVKQENYARMLELLAPYVRNPEAASDNFTVAFLQTWVIGSKDVLRAGDLFLKHRDWVSLDMMLGAMREDLSLEMYDDLGELSSKELFPPPTQQQGLRQ